MKYAVVLVLLFSTAHAQHQGDVGQLHLKGSVKTITEHHYRVTIEDGMKDTVLAGIDTMRFNDNGTITEKTTCPSYSDNCFKSVYLYDSLFDRSRGRMMTRLNKIMKDGDSGKLYDDVSYTYKEDCSSTSEQTVSWSSWIVEEACSGEVTTTGGSHFECTGLSLYDTNGLITESKWVDSAGACLQRAVYRYDTGKRLLMTVQTGAFSPWLPLPPPRDKSVITRKLAYNKAGDIATISHYSRSKRTRSERYKYLYDDAGNWIERRLIEQGEITEINKRVVEYRK